MSDINFISISGHLARDPIYKEPDGYPPCMEIIVVNNRPAGPRDEDGKRKEVVTTFKVVLWAGKAKAAQRANMKKGTEFICYGGYLRADNVSLPTIACPSCHEMIEQDGTTRGRLRIENPEKFDYHNKADRFEEAFRRDMEEKED